MNLKNTFKKLKAKVNTLYLTNVKEEKNSAILPHVKNWEWPDNIEEYKSIVRRLKYIDSIYPKGEIKDNDLIAYYGRLETMRDTLRKDNFYLTDKGVIDMGVMIKDYLSAEVYDVSRDEARMFRPKDKEFTELLHKDHDLEFIASKALSSEEVQEFNRNINNIENPKELADVKTQLQFHLNDTDSLVEYHVIEELLKKANVREKYIVDQEAGKAMLAMHIMEEEKEVNTGLVQEQTEVII